MPRTTHTYALLEVPKELHDLVRAKMEAADYHHAINDEGEIDMHGIALVPDDKPTGLNLAVLRLVNAARSRRWHAEGEDWISVDWSNAMAGEAGEACNAVKKLRRIETGTYPGSDNDPATREAAIAKIAEEIADTLLYADLLADHLGIDLSKAVIDKFNRKSEEMGFPERLK